MMAGNPSADDMTSYGLAEEEEQYRCVRLKVDVDLTNNQNTIINYSKLLANLNPSAAENQGSDEEEEEEEAEDEDEEDSGDDSMEEVETKVDSTKLPESTLTPSDPFIQQPATQPKKPRRKRPDAELDVGLYDYDDDFIDDEDLYYNIVDDTHQIGKDGGEEQDDLPTSVSEYGFFVWKGGIQNFYDLVIENPFDNPNIISDKNTDQGTDAKVEVNGLVNATKKKKKLDAMNIGSPSRKGKEKVPLPDASPSNETKTVKKKLKSLSATLPTSSASNTPSKKRKHDMNDNTPLSETSMSASKIVKLNKNDPLPLSLTSLFTTLRTQTSQIVIPEKKFPEQLNPISLRIATQIKKLDIWDDDRVWKECTAILPWNTFTIKKYFNKIYTRDRSVVARVELENSYTNFKNLVDQLSVGLPEKTEETTEGKTEVKFKFTSELKQLLLAISMLEIEIAELDIELEIINSKTKSNQPRPVVSDMAIRKLLYLKLLEYFPTGYMTTSELSRQLSLQKRKIEGTGRKSLSNVKKDVKDLNVKKEIVKEAAKVIGK